MDKIEFHHTLPMQIRFNDVDKLGHVNNTIYFQYYDTAKTNYLSKVCENLDWKKESIVVAHIDSDFLSQIKADNNVAVRTAVIKIGHKSFTLYQEIFDIDTNEIKCTCTSIMVAYNMVEDKSMLLPVSWINAISEFEGHDFKH